MNQIKLVIIPRENEKDIKEIPARILKVVELVPVDHMDEVLKLAMAVDDPESLFKAPSPAPVSTEQAYVSEGDQPPTLQAH